LVRVKNHGEMVCKNLKFAKKEQGGNHRDSKPRLGGNSKIS